MVISIVGILLSIAETLFVIKYTNLFKSKGYRNSWIDRFWYMLIISVFMLGGLLSVILSLMGLFNAKDFEIIFLIIWLICYLILLIVFMALVNNLPTKNMKIYGKLEEPWWLIYFYYFALGIGICGAVLAILSFTTDLFEKYNQSFIAKILSLSLLGMIPYYFNKIKLYKHQKEENDFVGQPIDVFYLRSFLLDDLSFAKASIKNREEFGETKANSTVLNKMRLTFSDFFGKQINEQLGVMVCLGNPGDRNPKEWITPIFPNTIDNKEKWKDLVREYMSWSKIILMQIANSKEVKYELEEIVTSGNLHKLCLFTEPTDEDFKQTWKNQFRNWIKNSRKLTWEEMKEVIEKSTIKIDFTPSAGSVIVFTKNNEAVLLKKGCVLPSEYISAVKEHFDF